MFLHRAVLVDQFHQPESPKRVVMAEKLSVVFSMETAVNN